MTEIRSTASNSVHGRRVLVTVYNTGRGTKTGRRHHHLAAAYHDGATSRLESVRSFVEKCQELVTDKVAAPDGFVHTFGDLTKVASEATLASHKSGESVTFVSKVPKAFALEVSRYGMYRPDLPILQRQSEHSTACSTRTTLPALKPAAAARYPQGSAKSRTYSGPVPCRELDKNGIPQNVDGYRSDVDGHSSS